MTERLKSIDPFERCILLLKLYGYELDASNELIKYIFWLRPDLYKGVAQITAFKKELSANIQKLEEKEFLRKTNQRWELRPDINHWELFLAFLKQDKKLLTECQRLTNNEIDQYFNEEYHDDKYTEYLINVIRVSVVLKQRNSFMDRYGLARNVLHGSDWLELMKDLVKGYRIIFNRKKIDRKEKKSAQLQALVLNKILMNHIQMLLPSSEWLLEEISDPGLRFGPDCEYVLYNRGLILLFRGEWKALEKLIQDINTPAASCLKGILDIFRGHYQAGIDTFREGIELFRRDKKFNPAGLDFIQGTMPLFWFMALSKGRNEAATLEKSYRNGLIHFSDEISPLSPRVFEHLEVLLFLETQNIQKAIHMVKNSDPQTVIDLVINTIFSLHLDIKTGSFRRKKLQECLEDTREHDFTWLQMELNWLLSKIEENELKRDAYSAEYEKIAEELGAVSLGSMYEPKELWASTLEQLDSFFNAKNKSTVQEFRAHKLAVYVELEPGLEALEMKVKKRRKNGSWTPGRKINFQSMIQLGNWDLSPREYNLLTCFQDYLYDNYMQHRDEMNFQKKILELLIDFDDLYASDNHSLKLKLKKDSPRMFMEEGEDEIKISYNYFPMLGEDFEVFRTAIDEYVLVEYTADQLEMFEHFSTPEMTFPASVSEQVLQFTEKFADIIPLETLLQSELKELPRKKGDATPHVQLFKENDEYALGWCVRPQAGSSQLFHPGEGKEIYKIQMQEGETALLERDFIKEIALFEGSLEALALPQEHQISKHEWILPNDEKCLEVLLQIQDLKNEQKVIVEWPKGQQLSLASTFDSRHLKFHVSRGKNYWFDVEAEIESEDDLAISFKQLLALTEDSSKKFIQLSNQQFVGITDDLRKHLNTARAVLQKDKNNSYKMHAVAAPAMDEIMESAGYVSMDEYWQEAKDKFEKAKNIRPRLPKSLKAKLRPYQKKGFKWMMQLAEWGVGGCLADDMGLGKTIQALAVLCARKDMGPALVVAPASVTHNWLRETEKFAPGIKAEIFGPGDREEMLDNLGKGSLLICSYGLMHSEIDRLEKVDFQMLLLDEAQAIKNFTTRRYKAAVRLQGEFRMATTGTPIENHLGELWSLFNFLNPGMLGTTTHFKDKFAKAINSGEEEALQRLKKLVQPFIMRRHKDQVLKDLPPKTEINHTVALTKEEKALYEGMRRLSLDKIQKTMDQRKNGQNHITVLAELTKLRRACCHPSLVNSQLKMKGSKLESLKELVTSLIENDHKVLVFSQFVDFLKIVRHWMDQSAINYQYLDGSTPVKKREKAVQAFQNGDGEAFLISLKAGGVGLNLTAADYVLILDPWWNPAVESQAADRAHRMGQKKPVTVYRFVTENTIEEKIIELHKTKQELAESLLQGSDKAGKISTHDLIELLHSNDMH